MGMERGIWWVYCMQPHAASRWIHFICTFVHVDRRPFNCLQTIWPDSGESEEQLVWLDLACFSLCVQVRPLHRVVVILLRFQVVSISLHVAVQLLADNTVRFMRNDVFRSQLYLGYLVRSAQVGLGYIDFILNVWIEVIRLLLLCIVTLMHYPCRCLSLRLRCTQLRCTQFQQLSCDPSWTRCVSQFIHLDCFFNRRLLFNWTTGEPRPCWFVLNGQANGNSTACFLSMPLSLHTISTAFPVIHPKSNCFTA